MRILSWMQNKLNGKQGNNKPTGGLTNNHIVQEPRKEEFSDWPHGLLAIGTFGNNEIKQDQSEARDPEENLPSSSEDQLDFTPEEVGKLRKELTKLLSRKPTHIDQSDRQTKDGSNNNLPLDKFLNCPSSLEVDRTITCQTVCEDSEDKDDDGDDVALQHSNSVMLSKGKDVYFDGKTAEIRKRSISFLLKKMFVCRSGFAPAPSLRDPIPETRMEKLLRTILHKNICPQKSAAKSTRKYLENRHSSNTDAEDQLEERGNKGCKWVKTDSEYIVLEI